MSLKRKIDILFFVVFILLFSLYYLTQQEIEKKQKEFLTTKYIDIAQELYPLLVDVKYNILEKKAKKYNLKPILKIDIKDYEVLKNIKLSFGSIKVLKKANSYYLIIEYLNDKKIFISNSQNSITIILVSIFLGILFLFAILYLWIQRLFKPIKELEVHIKNLSKGKKLKNISYKEYPKEIKSLFKSFDDMSNSLKNSLKEREHLIKYVGHEIKTPLAKAKFAYEKRDLNLIKQNLNEIENIINSILTMHTISLDNLKKESFSIELLIVETLQLLPNIDESHIEIEVENFKITADSYWLKIALKNLIDNALKYSTKYPIKIVAKNRRVEIISYGDRLKNDLTFYTTIFNRASSKKDGYGIGLSIVEMILQKHNLKLKYRYLQNSNIFYIEL